MHILGGALFCPPHCRCFMATSAKNVARAREQEGLAIRK